MVSPLNESEEEHCCRLMSGRWGRHGNRGAARFRGASPATCWPLALPPPSLSRQQPLTSSNINLNVNLSVEIKQIIKYKPPNLKNQTPFIVVSYIKEIQNRKGRGGRGFGAWSVVGPVPPGPSLPTVSSPCCSWREADAILLAELTLSGRSQSPVLTGATLSELIFRFIIKTRFKSLF